MPVTAADVQQIILSKIQDDGTIAQQMPILWESRAAKASVAPELQALYVLRDAIDMLQGSVWRIVDESTDGTGLRQNQLTTQLQVLRKNTEDEIRIVEARAGANRTPAIGTITTVAPVSAPGPLPVYGPPEANDPRYSGSPYRPLPYGGRW